MAQPGTHAAARVSAPYTAALPSGDLLVPATTPLIDAAVALRPLLRAQAATIEDERRLTVPVLDALNALDAFHLQLTGEHGGSAADPITHLRVIEELSRGDASTGWCAMVGSEASACINAFLPAHMVRQMVVGTPRPMAALTAVGRGRAVAATGGYRVSGRWRFTSGCRHATWLGGLAVVHDGATPRLRDNGAPTLRVVFARADSAELIDTWHTSGLQGTASDDFALHDVFVPLAQAADLSGAAVDPSPVWRLPPSLRFALSKAAAVCGTARAALDCALPLLERTPFVGGRPAREEARVQIALAEAEAALEGGRAYLYQNVQQAWDGAMRGAVLVPAGVARVRLAVIFAARQALEAAQRTHALVGSAAIFDATLDRAVRDLNVARHHLQLQPHIVEDVGRVMLGLAPRNPMF